MDNFQIYIYQILNGVGLGMIYFLMAVGLTLIFGLLNFVNFAHGAFFLLGAYLCYTLVSITGNFWLALVAAPLAVAFIGFGLERTLVRRLYSVPHIFQILVTLGLALIIQELVIIIWGSVGKSIPAPDVLKGIIQIGDFFYPTYRLFVICFSALIAILLWLVLDRTRFGALVRAGSESTEMVSLLGCNIFRLFSITFALGAGLAALAGVLSVPIRGAYPFLGPEVLAIAFVVVVIGGMGSFTGALAAGLLVGIVESTMSSVWSGGANLMIYIAMAVIIVLRPHGLFGRV